MPTTDIKDGQATTPTTQRKRAIWAKIALSLVVATICYATVESLLTYAYLSGKLDPELIWVIEQTDAAPHMKTDAVRGYKLSPSSARMACITTDGRVESVGKLQGNNYGYPDQHDFRPHRTQAGATRLAVFGDSFTAGPYMDVNWPDRVEEIAARTGQPIELLNFSVFGGGLGNWWSCLTKIIDAEDFQLDGVIFVVFVDDLDRAFYACDDSHPKKTLDGADPRLTCGFSDSFDPNTFDDVELHAMRYTRLLSPETFDLALEGQWHPDYERPFELFVLKRARSVARRWWAPASATETKHAAALTNDDSRVLSEEQIRLIDDMAAFLKKRGIPAWVYHFPAGSPVDEARAFADRLGAGYIDASAAFHGIDQAEKDACFMIDGHWNQTGSDRFAKWFIKVNGG